MDGQGPQLWPFLFTSRVDTLIARWGGYYSQVRVSYYLLATSCKLLVTSYLLRITSYWLVALMMVPALVVVLVLC